MNVDVTFNKAVVRYLETKSPRKFTLLRDFDKDKLLRANGGCLG